jgi:hypothetical protein
MEFILREHTRRNAFQEMLDLFTDSCGDGQASERGKKGLDGVTPLDGDEEDEELREPDGDRQSAKADVRTITWPKSPRKLWRIVKADIGKSGSDYSTI